jgi:L-malate glycosyltransferase
MKVGLAGPITVSAFKAYLENYDEKHLALGMPGTAVQTLAIGLMENGNQVSIYTLAPQITTPITLKGPQLTIYIGVYRSNYWFRMADFFGRESKQIKKFILQDQPDFVNAHWSYEFAVAAIQSKYPHLVTFRDSAWEIFRYHRDSYRVVRWLIDYWVKKRAKFFSVNSFYLRDKLAYIKKDLPIIPNPINDSFIRHESKTQPNTPYRIISILNGFWHSKNSEKNTATK